MASPEPYKTILFESKAWVYRIPSLLYIEETKTFLAMAEKRGTHEDVDAQSLVLRRGHLQNQDVQWDDVVELEKALLPGYRTMGPCPVYDRDQRVVFLFFTCIENGVTEGSQIFTGRNAARLCMVKSSDAGVTWSELVDLTNDVIGDRISTGHIAGKWATHAVGPGHGIQMACGRLVVPAYAYLIYYSCWIFTGLFTYPHALYLYSEDHGQTWLVSELVSELQTLECEAAEVTRPDASPQLYLNTRIKKQGLRAEVVSLEPGSLHKPTLAQELVETGYNGCQGSVVSFPGPSPSPTRSNNQPFWLVFTHPTDKKDRVDLGVYVDPLSRPTPGWSKPWLINRGPSAYSDLAYVATCGAFGCLYERGDTNYWEQIVFCLFTVQEMMEHVGISDSGP
ncbi:sialidase-3-like [Callorhinchus milii]|uniref:exo-alpha-sialidase n=1 Tax=Callorhinchus milii TaxID=7868 RepID=A0A4W3IU20_CALMI|nr:sialidase-3-like [Callorhinchus milii]|eukprot:gi/632976655/ref/XP_007904916.1/ PREDICTED: sialidase-3-like [Callorhinchus milii]